MFQGDTDPWDYASSPFEALKREHLLQACGPETYDRGLELGCANGETSRRLARQCGSLLAVDASPTIIQTARARVREPNITFEVRELPAQTPSGPFDLIVAAELLYYLELANRNLLVERLLTALAPRGRVVLLHHAIDFDDAAQPPAQAQARAEAALTKAGLARVFQLDQDRYRVAAFSQS